MSSNTEVLEKLYNDPLTGFVGADKLMKVAKQTHPDMYWTLPMVKEFLANQSTSQLHKTKKKVFIPITAPYAGYNYQMDLMDMGKIKYKIYRFVLCVIDVYSRFAWAIALKDKTAESVAEGFEKILQDGVPVKVGSDNGKEFLNSKMKAIMDKNKIIHFTAEKGDHSKMGMIERFNRTIRSKITLYMTAKDTNDWVSVLPSLVSNYNNTIHGSIKEKPINVFKKSQEPRVDPLTKKRSYFN